MTKKQSCPDFSKFRASFQKSATDATKPKTARRGGFSQSVKVGEKHRLSTTVKNYSCNLSKIAIEAAHCNTHCNTVSLEF